MNFLSCHELTEKRNSTVILKCQYCLVNYYLEKGFVIIKYKYKQVISVLNNVKLIFHAIDKQKNRLFYGEHHSNFLSIKHHKEIEHSFNLHFFTNRNYITINKIVWMNCLINTVFPY